MRKERWLEFHDRFTSGIPGLLPLVLNLPIRFTESLGQQAREMGVFKHTRGILRGWELEEEELQRLRECTEPEVVLKRRPLRLYVEVPTATARMPKTGGKSIYILRVQQKQWTLDKSGNVKILRFGFPVVPDFGGTAHAYCGSTVEATMGDLLPWSKKPQLADMLKAYIIKSRVRLADKLLLAQPYSPHLFRQGLLPGPQLLLDVLLGNITEEAAKAAWKKIEKAKKEAKAKTDCWSQEQTLPCRRCTDNSKDGQEVWKPISAFGTDVLPRDIWQNIVSRGQDAICFNCRSELGDEATLNFMCCEGCGVVKPVDKFDAKERKRWQSLDRHAVLCLACTGAATTRHDAEMVECHGHLCDGRQLPEYHFVESLLTAWRAKNIVTGVRCARCWVQDTRCERKDEATSVKKTCVSCQKDKPMTEFAPIAIKEWLGKVRNAERWR